jgi:ferrochelatase
MNGLLLLNLGTPAAPTPPAIRRWLRQFLHDHAVVDTPRWIWCPVLYGIILPLRPRKLVPLYSRIWTAGGSPLLVNSRAQREALASALGLPVAEGMRYGEPSIESALARLRGAGVTGLVTLPLYPQYSGTTTGSSDTEVDAALARLGWTPRLLRVTDYHADPGYVAALAASVREHWARHGRGDRLLVSFHSIPQRYVDRGDPYEQHCRGTARALAEALQLAPDAWQLAYQSRIGRRPWLQPYTDEVIAALPAAGVRRLDVIAPGFAADCLETLDEIAIRYAEAFVAAGGEALRYVPALNARPDHVAALARIVRAQLEG